MEYPKVLVLQVPVNVLMRKIIHFTYKTVKHYINWNSIECSRYNEDKTSRDVCLTKLRCLSISFDNTNLRNLVATMQYFSIDEIKLNDLTHIQFHIILSPLFSKFA